MLTISALFARCHGYVTSLFVSIKILNLSGLAGVSSKTGSAKISQTLFQICLAMEGEFMKEEGATAYIILIAFISFI